MSEQARFLLRELQALLIDDGLVDSDEVVVVAARFAYPEYLKRGLYICQAGRSFRGGLTHLGFYAEGAIQTHVPRIRHREDLITFTHETAAARRGGSDTDRLIGDAIETDLAAGTQERANSIECSFCHNQTMLTRCDWPSRSGNDTVAESGRPWAWTMGQRYVSLAGLTRPGMAVTSDLFVRRIRMTSDQGFNPSSPSQSIEWATS